MEEFKILEIEEPVLPERSRLYSIEPMGKGTPAIEALTSIISRLAEAHLVRVGTLVSHELTLGMDKKYFQRLDHRWFLTYAKTINGTGLGASLFVQLYEERTGQKDIKSLTMLTFAKIFPVQELTRAEHAWCPECYEDMRESGLPTYNKLVWALKGYRICTKHEGYLRQVCPHCKRKIPVIGRKKGPGYCTVCHNWLGERLAGEFENKEGSDEETRTFDLWAAKQIGELISRARTLENKISSSNVQKILCKYIEIFFDKNLTAFANEFGINKITAWGWAKGKHRPNIMDQLRFCYQAGLNLWELLTENLDDVCNKAKFPERSKLIHYVFKKKVLKTVHKKTISKSLVNALKKENKISISKISAELGVSKKSLYRHFPEETRKISALYKENKRINAEENLKKACEKVRKIITDIVGEGEYPSRRKIIKRIDQESLLRREEVITEVENIKKELGLIIKKKIDEV